MKRLLYFISTLWLLLWVQIISNHFLGGTLVSVQWSFLAVLHFGLSRGPWMGEWVGFILGILLDASSLGLLGLRAALFTVAGYFSGIFRRQLDSSKVWTQAIFSWMASVVYFTLYYIVSKLLSFGEEPFHWRYLTVPIVNALVAPLVFRALAYWAHLWDMVPEERSSEWSSR